MKRNQILKNVDIRKYYLIRKPTRLSDVDYEDLDVLDDYTGWREKSMKMQARRWRAIKHQEA